MIWPFKRAEARALTSWDLLQGTTYYSASGLPISPEKASGLAVAHRAISVISESLSGVPLKVYRKTENGGREAETSNPLYSVLHDQMSPSLTAFEGREFLIASILIYGNAYARIERNGRGPVIALHPLVPGTVTVERLATGRLRYKVAKSEGGTETLLADEMLHLRGRTKDGVLGQSPIQIAASSFGLAIAQQEQAGSQAENAFRPAGALVFPEKIGGTSKTDIISKFKDRFVGALKAGEVMVLDGGADFKTFQFSAKDSEFLESRKLSNLDIARAFGVPPTTVGILDHGTYSNVESESRALVARCLAPMAKRIEQAMMVSLLSPDARKSGLYLEHELSALLRGDVKSRYDAYRVGREGGWLNVDEIRAFENMSAVDGGQTFLQPLNYGRLGDNSNEPSQVAA